MFFQPDNILIGGADHNQLFLIDLGLAKKFRNKSEHVPYRRHGMVGTVRYASINTHREIQQSEGSKNTLGSRQFWWRMLETVCNGDKL